MENKLYILWTNDNVLTAEHMLLLYATKTMEFKLWDEITIIIWGATSKLVADNENIKNLISDAQKAGVMFTGCIKCAEDLGTKQALLNQGIELIPWGKPLTELIKNKNHLLTI